MPLCAQHRPDDDAPMDIKRTTATTLTPQRLGERTVARLRRATQVLPEGRPLGEGRWRRRHRFITWLAAAHVPALVVVGHITGRFVVHGLVDILPILVALALGLIVTDHRRAELATATALLLASGVAVHLSGGFIEAHFHFFVVLGVISMYQSWRTFLLAIAFVFVHHGLTAWIATPEVYNHPAALAHPWRWAAIHAAYMTATAAVHMIAWKCNELAQLEAQNYHRRLYEGEQAVVRELQAAQKLKEDLLASVSHEFRTPLTAILGFGKVLHARNGQLPDEQRDQYLQRLIANGHRLEQLISNLTHTGTDDRDEPRIIDLAQATSRAIDTVVDIHTTTRPWTTAVPAGISVHIDHNSLQHILVNLLDNAQKFSTPNTEIIIEAHRRDDATIEFAVTNSGPTIPQTECERIFEPFVQIDASSRRETGGVGFGLHLVRRLVRAHGGDVAVSCAADTVTFTAALPTGAQPPARQGAPTSTANSPAQDAVGDPSHSYRPGRARKGHASAPVSLSHR